VFRVGRNVSCGSKFNGRYWPLSPLRRPVIQNPLDAFAALGMEDKHLRATDRGIITIAEVIRDDDRPRQRRIRCHHSG
jgi:hypothetical protein